MAHGRAGVGVALLLAFAGSAAAQPTYPTYSGGSGVVPAAPVPPPALFPPGSPPIGPTGPTVVSQPAPFVPSTPPAQSNIQPISAFVNDSPPVRELPSEFHDLIPPPDKHHGGLGCDSCGGHETPEWLEPFVPRHGGWYTSGEYLMMRPRDSGFDYAIRNANPGLGTIGLIDTLKYPLSSGFRAELGYRFGEGKWEAAFAYTYFGAHGGATDVAGPNQILLPTLTRPGLTDRALFASTEAKLNYNLYDMIVGRRMAVDENFAIRWLGGFRFADIRQKFNALYNGLDARTDAVDSRSSFKGFGPLVGAEAVLGGWHGLHFYARGTVGLISGLNSNPFLETNDSGATTYINTNYSVRKIVPTGTLSIGGGWEYRTVFIRAGYEITHWQGIFDRPRFVDDVSQGKFVARSSNLTLEGLFVQVGLSY
jgi:hypothetical protein